jgi:hypothetical protein
MRRVDKEKGQIADPPFSLKITGRWYRLNVRLGNILIEWVRADRRFDAFDSDRLVAKVEEAGKSGAQLDLTDPYLRGGQKRPLSR